MKASPSVGLIVALLNSSSLAKATLRQEVISSLRDARIDRLTCQRMIDVGQLAGQRTYRQLFRSCNDFLLSEGAYDDLFSPLAIAWDTDEGCYESGFRAGYILETVRQWSPCAERFQTALAQANDELVKKCELSAHEMQGKFVSLASDLRAALSKKKILNGLRPWKLFFT